MGMVLFHHESLCIHKFSLEYLNPIALYPIHKDLPMYTVIYLAVETDRISHEPEIDIINKQNENSMHY